MKFDKKKIFEELRILFVLVIVAFTVKATLVEIYVVPTGSMENEILVGDMLIGNKFIYGMRTPTWIGIPYTRIGFNIPWFRLPAFKNIKNLLTDFKGPILGSLNEREDIKELIPTEYDLDIDLNLNMPNSDHAPGVIIDWVKKFDIDTVYLTGFHYNLCLRGVYNACELVPQALPSDWPREWRKNFQALIIEECTAVLLDDKVMTLQEYYKSEPFINTIKLADVPR